MAFPYGGATILAVFLLLTFTALFFFLLVWLRRGRLAETVLRPLPAIDLIRSALRRAAEMGEAVHVSPGTGALHDGASAAETLAGLQTVQGVAREALALGVPVQVTTNDAVVNMLSGHNLELAKEAAGNPPGLQAESLLVAQQNPIAYAAGAISTLGQTEVQGNVAVGTFGEELLLIGEVGARKTNFQVAGAARPLAAAILPLITNHFLLGEEIFAAGAYLSPRPARTVSLRVQDYIRGLLIMLILLGVILATLGIADAVLGPLFRLGTR